MTYAHCHAITIDKTKVVAHSASVTPVYPRDTWSATADSQYTTYAPSYTVDTEHTIPWASGAGYPHYLIVDMGAAETFDVVFVNNAGAAAYTTGWELYVSDDGATWGSAVATGTWTGIATQQITLGSLVTKRYLKLVGTAGTDAYMRIMDIWVARQVKITDPHPNFRFLDSRTYVYLKDAAHGGEVQSPDGFDIIYTSDSAGLVQLPHEIDTYDPTTGALNFWVGIPELPVGADPIIYRWHGNAEIATSQENKSGLWNDGLGIYHGGDGTTLSVADSLGSHNGTNHSASAAAGAFAGAMQFVAASNQWVDLNDPINPGLDATLILQAVVKVSSLIQFQRILSNLTGSNYNGYEFFVGETVGHSEFTLQVGVNNYLVIHYEGSDLGTSAWAWLAAIASFGNFRRWINGASASASGEGGQPGTSNVNCNIGRWSGGASNYFDGLVEELRILKWNKVNIYDTALFATEYANQNDPDTFYSVSDDIAPSPGGARADFWPVLSRLIAVRKIG